MGLAILFVFGALLVAWFAGEPRRVAWRRRRLRRAPFPAAWRAILRARVPAFRRLPADLQLQLKKHIQVFLAEKRFVGCAGVEVTDEMRVTIAAQACLLLLNRRSDYFARLTEVLVYPGAFAARRTQADAAGVLHERRDVMSGESWVQGQVVLSWDDVLQGAADPDDGRNVVIHEFAHQLDQEKGEATGAPQMSARRQARWTAVMGEAFARLRGGLVQPSLGAFDGLPPAPPLIDPYAATSPAEFFAVVSEAFFERPQSLSAGEPALYRALAGYYRVDPLTWS